MGCGRRGGDRPRNEPCAEDDRGRKTNGHPSVRTAGVSPAASLGARPSFATEAERVSSNPASCRISPHARTRNPPRVRDTRTIIVQCHARISAGGIPARARRRIPLSRARTRRGSHDRAPSRTENAPAHLFHPFHAFHIAQNDAASRPHGGCGVASPRRGVEESPVHPAFHGAAQSRAARFSPTGPSPG